MIFNMIGLVIGILILGAGIYYLSKDKNDPESKKIYGITSIVGAVIVIAFIIKILMSL